MPFDKHKYNNEFRGKTYDTATMLIPKGTRQVLKAIAENKNTTMNELILGAVEKKFKLDIKPNKKK